MHFFLYKIHTCKQLKTMMISKEQTLDKDYDTIKIQHRTLFLSSSSSEKRSHNFNFNLKL